MRGIMRLLTDLFSDKVWLVGGAVRDHFLMRGPADLDFVVEGMTIEKVAETLQNYGIADLVGAHFGVIKFGYDDGVYDVAVPRKDHSTGSGHKDFTVETKGISIVDDLGRRDFTVNAMAKNLLTGEIADPFNGLDDLNRGQIRAVSANSFAEDPLRMLRAIRFACRFGFDIEAKTYDEMMASSHLLISIPVERYKKEIGEMLLTSPKWGMQTLKELGLLRIISPLLDSLEGVSQPPEYHYADVWGHTLDALDNSSGDLVSRLAALFHDCGKPTCRQETDGKITFHGHEEVSAKLTKSEVLRLGFGAEMAEVVSLLVANHMKIIDYSASPKALRGFVVRIGKKNVPQMIDLMWCDLKAHKLGNKNEGAFLTFAETLRQIAKSPVPGKISDLAINGNDVMTILGVKPGPVLGFALRQLYEMVIDNPSLNTKEMLTALLNTPCIEKGKEV